jgi:hypothetical protein
MAPSKKTKQRRVTKPGSIYSSTMPYSPGVPSAVFKVSAGIQKFTTTVTTGVIASSTAIQAAQIPSFGSRFAAFDEYRITHAKFMFYPCSSTNPGTLNAWVEPQSSGTPSSSIAQNNKVLAFPIGGNNRVYKLNYSPTDFNFEGWTDLATTTFVIGYLNVYTNNADFASNIVATDAVTVRAEYTVEFRGFK